MRKNDIVFTLAKDDVVGKFQGYTAIVKKESKEYVKGELIAKFLHLKEKNGRYDTLWGDKTAEGLYLSIKRIIKEKDIKI